MEARAAQEVGVRTVPEAVWERYRRRWGFEGTAAVVLQAFLDAVVRSMLAREYVTTTALVTAVTDFDNKLLASALNGVCGELGDVCHPASDANIAFSTPVQRGLYRMCFIEIATEMIAGPPALYWNDALGGMPRERTRWDPVLAAFVDSKSAVVTWRPWSPFGLPAMNVGQVRAKTIHERLERIHDLKSSVRNFPFPATEGPT